MFSTEYDLHGRVCYPIREGGKIDPRSGVDGRHVADQGMEDSMPSRGVIADVSGLNAQGCEQTLTA